MPPFIFKQDTTAWEGNEDDAEPSAVPPPMHDPGAESTEEEPESVEMQIMRVLHTQLIIPVTFPASL